MYQALAEGCREVECQPLLEIWPVHQKSKKVRLAYGQLNAEQPIRIHPSKVKSVQSVAIELRN